MSPRILLRVVKGQLLNGRFCPHSSQLLEFPTPTNPPYCVVEGKREYLTYDEQTHYQLILQKVAKGEPYEEWKNTSYRIFVNKYTVEQLK